MKMPLDLTLAAAKAYKDLAKGLPASSSHFLIEVHNSTLLVALEAFEGLAVNSAFEGKSPAVVMERIPYCSMSCYFCQILAKITR